MKSTKAITDPEPDSSVANTRTGKVYGKYEANEKTVRPPVNDLQRISFKKQIQKTLILFSGRFSER